MMKSVIAILCLMASISMGFILEMPMASNNACMYSDTVNSKYYDLNPLSVADYEVTDSTNVNFKFKLNPCKELTTLPINTICASGTYACQVSTSSGVPSYLVGKTLVPITVDSTGTITLQMTGGDYCPGNGNYRAAVITFTCGTTVGAPVYVSEDRCSYKFTWTTSAACPSSKPPSSSSGLSVGSILCIVFFCLLIVYLAAGSAYNYKVKEARGVEMVPNIDFWRGLPSLVKDGCTFTVERTKALLGRS